MNRPKRVVAATAVALTFTTMTACSGQSATARSGPATTVTAAPSATPVVEIPDTPLGDALRWLLDASTRPPVAESELAERLAPEFLAQVPAEAFNQTLAAFKDMRLQRLSVAHATALFARVEAGGKPYNLELSVDGAGRISGARLSEPPAPQPTPASWRELDQRLRKAAPEVAFVAAEVTGRTCRPAHGVAAGDRRPLGSMFKLYVLGTVAERIRSGAFGWDTALTITPELKSLPTGQLQDRPDGSKVTVLEAAKLMISISDNTATDLLIHKVGKKAVERTMRAWTGENDRRNVPLLTTRELFALKGADHPRLARRYLSMDDAKQRAYLAKVVAKVPLSDIKPWPAPRELDTIEWYASPDGICRAYAELAKLGDERIAEVMSITDAGLGLDKGQWPSVWFKGGSEAGVLDMSFLARSADDRTFVVTVMSADPAKPLDEGSLGQEFLALVRGAFALARNS
ncbi:serine hydrolase [Nonomuraea sp. LPB2021202275-12-8]|uniref:serine hydrolase n=1 Tax=Nonomuraea sp. LPB2021202275-12-8 TaxID=3120159 RepID=UPI00300D22B7